MNSLAGTPQDQALPAPVSINLDALRGAALATEPFPYLIVPGFVRSSAHALIGADFPNIEQSGSFPLSTLHYGPAFRTFLEEIQGPEMSAAVAAKFGIVLSQCPTMVTVRGISREADGKIHADSRSKLLTALIYMNDSWESPKGRLRLLRSPQDLDSIIAEVPPDRGTLLIFRNDLNAWHGFESYSGLRRVIQLNWVTNARVVRREQARHRISAFFKRLRNRKS